VWEEKALSAHLEKKNALGVCGSRRKHHLARRGRGTVSSGKPGVCQNDSRAGVAARSKKGGSTTQSPGEEKLGRSSRKRRGNHRREVSEKKKTSLDEGHDKETEKRRLLCGLEKERGRWARTRARKISTTPFDKETRVREARSREKSLGKGRILLYRKRCHRNPPRPGTGRKRSGPCSVRRYAPSKGKNGCTGRPGNYPDCLIEGNVRRSYTKEEAWGKEGGASSATSYLSERERNTLEEPAHDRARGKVEPVGKENIHWNLEGGSRDGSLQSYKVLRLDPQEIPGKEGQSVFSVISLGGRRDIWRRLTERCSRKIT